MHENLILDRSGLHLQNLSKSNKAINKRNVSNKKKTFLHGAHVDKTVLKLVTYPIKTIEVRIGRGLDFTSRSWLSP